MTSDVTGPAITDPDAFIRVNTQVLAPPLVPEIKLHQATEVTDIWEATEAKLEEIGLPPPFWAFAWAGGQALARYLLDNPETVAGKTVLDFAAGSGLSAIAAMKAGAANVLASEIDPFAGAAMRANAVLNDVQIDVVVDDVVGRRDADWSVILAGDVCYEKAMADRIFTWLQALAQEGRTVLIGDPNRTYLPKSGLEPIANYSVPTVRLIEDTDVRNARVWHVLPL